MGIKQIFVDGTDTPVFALFRKQQRLITPWDQVMYSRFPKKVQIAPLRLDVKSGISRITSNKIDEIRVRTDQRALEFHFVVVRSEGLHKAELKLSRPPQQVD